MMMHIGHRGVGGVNRCKGCRSTLGAGAVGAIERERERERQREREKRKRILTLYL